jgi:hypothetical protein
MCPICEVKFGEIREDEKLPFLSTLEEYLEEAKGLALIPQELITLRALIEKCKDFKSRVKDCLDGPDRMDKIKIRDFLRCAEGLPVIVDPELHRLRLRLNALKDSTLYCLCQTQHDGETPMIGCDNCEEWFHFKCIRMDPEVGEKLENYICAECQPRIGSTVPVVSLDEKTVKKKVRKKAAVI